MQNEQMMVDVTNAVFRALRQMDSEAGPTKQGQPTGLCWYGPHRRPELKRPQTEPCWTQRLKELLTDAGYCTRAEVPYPTATNLRCDNVVVLPDGSHLWMETKGAWKAWWASRGGVGIYESYLLYPLKAVMPKTHTAPQDLSKLHNLSPDSAQHAAFLLVGFDAVTDPMDDDVAELSRLSGLDHSPWVAAHDVWPDSNRPGERISCWFWHRTVAEGESSVTITG